MPVGSSKLGFVKNAQYGVGGTGIPVDDGMNLTLSYTGNTGISIAATSLGVAMDSQFANTTVGYIIEGNIAGSDFSDGLVSGNVTLDADGNGSITKNIVTTPGAGHRDFTLSIIRPGSNVVIANTDTQYIYEMKPIEATGGDAVVSGSTPAGVHKIHKFTTPGNANISITNSTGNYAGNTNVWNAYFQTGNDSSFFRSDKIGLKYRGLIVGAAQSKTVNNNAGSGELGVLEYELANIANIEYTMVVGDNWTGSAGNYDAANSTIFANDGGGIKKTARFGKGGGGPATGGGSGSAGEYSGQMPSDLAESSANVAFPGNFLQYVTFASASHGSIGANAFTQGGGGAFGTGGVVPSGNSTNAYGFTVPNGGTIYGLAQGGKGAAWDSGTSDSNDFLNFYYNPLYGDTSHSNTSPISGFAGGGGTTNRAYVDSRGPSQQFLIVENGPGVTGQLGYGGGGTQWHMADVEGRSEYGPYNTSADASAAYSAGPTFTKQQAGIVTLSYPYANTKFITGTIIT